MNVVAVAAMIDDLWQRSIEDPNGIDDAALAEWLSESSLMLGAPVAKKPAAVLRKVVRLSRKLASYWGERDPASLPDWRNGVDEALGTSGWEPQLDLVRWSLESSPDPEAFAAMKERFRAVHFTPWMEEVSYEEWLDGLWS